MPFDQQTIYRLRLVAHMLRMTADLSGNDAKKIQGDDIADALDEIEKLRATVEQREKELERLA